MTGQKEGTKAPAIYRTLTPMPAAGAPSALYFDGKDVSDFLRSFKRLCRGHGVTADSEEMFEWLLEYCERWISYWVESTSGFCKRDWEVLESKVKLQFRDEDTAQKIYSLEHLERMSRESALQPENINRFVLEFTGISGKVLALGQLDEGYQRQLLLSGLPEGVHSAVISELKLSRAPRHEFKWDPVIQEVRKRLEKEDAKRRVREERGFQRMALLESRLQQKIRADPVAEANMVSDPYGAPSNDAGRCPGQPGGSDPAVSNITNQMQARVSNMPAPQINPERFARSQLGPGGVQGGIPYNHVGYGLLPAGYNPPRSGPCFYCGQEGHSQKRCHQLTSDITNGLIHLNPSSNKLHVGPPGQGREEIRIIRNIPTRSIA